LIKKQQAFRRIVLKVSRLGLMALAVVALVACDLTKYDVGGTVTGLTGSGLVLEDNLGDSLAITGNGAFTFSTGVQNSDAYSVTVSTQPSNPTQTCTVHNGAGTIDKAPVSHIIVTCTEAGQFAYVANQDSNDITVFAINATTGYLSQVSGSPFAAGGTTPVSVAVDPDGAYAYVANNGSNSVAVFSIEAGTGILTPVGEAVPTGTAPVAVIVDPSDNYLFVANQGSNNVSVYSISSGQLTEITGSPYAVGAGPSALATDPGSNFLYVANYTDGTVSAFTIAAATGALTGISGSPFAAGAGANSIAVDPTGTYAYVANESAATITAFSIAGTSGALSPVSGSPYNTGSDVQAISVDPAGAHVYAANATAANDVAAFAITPSSGALTVGANVAAGALPASLVLDPAGTFAYVVNFDSNDVSVYAIDGGTGGLSSVSGSPFLTGSAPRSIAVH